MENEINKELKEKVKKKKLDKLALIPIVIGIFFIFLSDELIPIGSILGFAGCIRILYLLRK